MKKTPRIDKARDSKARDAATRQATYEGMISTIPQSISAAQQLRNAMERAFPRLWAQSNILTETGKPLDFTHRPWLRDIWDDAHPRIAVQKPAQVGMTTWAYARALHRAALDGATVIYTLPTEDDVRDFVSGRLDKVINSSPVLQQLIGRSPVPGRRTAYTTEAYSAGAYSSGAYSTGAYTYSRRRPADNIELKHIGAGTIYFRGTQAEGVALSVPAQVLVHDEIDHSQPEKLEMYAHRLDSLLPDQRQVYQLSTPTVSGYGINAIYEASDARQWLVRCPGRGCGWQGRLDYWEHTEGRLLYLRCTRCGASLDPRAGQWVAAHPDRSGDTHGYLISRLFLALPDQPQVLQGLHQRRTSVQYERHFYNMDLGLTASQGTHRITREQILGACFLETYPMSLGASFVGQAGAGPYYMGVDQGDTLTVVVARANQREDDGHIRVVHVVRLRDPSRGSEAWRHLAELMDAFRVRMCVIDGNPNSANAHDLARQFPGRVLNCYYRDGMRAEVIEAADVRRRAIEARDGGLQTRVSSTDRVDVTVERTEALDRTAHDLIEGRFMLPSPPSHPEVEELMRQCEHNVRRTDEDRHGVPVYRWVRTGPNDYFHALNYVRLAVEEANRLRQLDTQVAPPVILRAVRRRR